MVWWKSLGGRRCGTVPLGLSVTSSYGWWLKRNALHGIACIGEGFMVPPFVLFVVVVKNVFLIYFFSALFLEKFDTGGGRHGNILVFMPPP